MILQIAINHINTVLSGKKIQAIAPITKNGPNGIYSSLLFKIAFRMINTKTETIAPTKNANNETCAILLTPKYKPNRSHKLYIA